MAAFPIHKRLDADQRFVLKHGTLSVESVKKYGQRSCFSKWIHHERYDSQKILAALQSFYSKSLTEDEAKCLKKNIRATLQHIAKENIKTLHMSALTRWLFHKHVVDLKPYTQTFEKLQRTTFRPKLLDMKDACVKVAKERKALKKQPDLYHALIEIPFVNKHIQEGMQAIKALKQSHRPAQDITELDNAENKYKVLTKKLKQECRKRNRIARKHTDALIKEAKQKANAKALKKCLAALETHRDSIATCKMKLSGSLKDSFKSLQHTEKVIKRCQKSLEALDNNPVYQQLISGILDKVKQFPSQTPFDHHYEQKANVCIDEAKLALKNIQKTLTATSATYKQIQTELAALENSRQLLKSNCGSLYEVVSTFPLMKKNHKDLKDFLSHDWLFSTQKRKLKHLFHLLNPPSKYDVILKHVKECIKVFDHQYEEYQKAFDFDHYVAESITPIEIALIAIYKHKPVQEDFTQNAHAIKDISDGVRLSLDIHHFLSAAVSYHPYYVKLASVLVESANKTLQELLEPYYKILTAVQLHIGNDLHSWEQDWILLEEIKKQYQVLKVCDPSKVFEKSLKDERKAIGEQFASHFKAKVKEIHTLRKNLKKKYNAPDLSKDQAKLFAQERDETQKKIHAIAEEHQAFITTEIPIIKDYEHKIKLEIDAFVAFSNTKTKILEHDVKIYEFIEKHLKSCEELQTHLDEFSQVEKISHYEKCLESLENLIADIEKRKTLPDPRSLITHHVFADKVLKSFQDKVTALHVSHKNLYLKIEKRLNDLTL